jgi:type IV secretory pathway component VirB8
MGWDGWNWRDWLWWVAFLSSAMVVASAIFLVALGLATWEPRL